MLALDPLVMELAPWSPSMADTAIDCPHAFYRKYIAHETLPETKAIESSVGTLVHHLLEWTLKEESPMTVDAAFKHAFSLDPPYEVYLQARTYRDAIKDFLGGITQFKKTNGVIRSFVEFKMALTPDFTGGDYSGKDAHKPLIRGVADYVLITKRGQATIFDHKTGSVKPLDMYKNQALVYSVCVDAMIPRLTSTRMVIHYVGTNPNAQGKRTVWAPEYPLETIRTHLREELITYLNNAAKGARSREPIKGWRCNYCEYKPVCPLQQKN